MLQLVVLLGIYNGTSISASAQKEPDSNGFETRGAAHATVSPNSTGDSPQDEYADLKLSSSVRQLAQLIKVSPETTSQLCRTLNFLLLLALVLWKGVPLLTAIFQERSRSIHQAIDAADRLKEDARKQLAEVERRWDQLDSAIAAIKAAGEEQSKNEENAFASRTAEETRRILEHAQFEIDKAALRARHELKAFVADLSVSLARRSMRIEKRTDQELVKAFIEGLSPYQLDQAI